MAEEWLTARRSEGRTYLISGPYIHGELRAIAHIDYRYTVERAETAERNLARLTGALGTELPILERLGGSTTPKQATQATARLRAALDSLEDE